MPPKRKRSTTLSSIKDSTILDVPQPSSRDASGEDAEDPVLQEVSSAKHKKTDASNPPSKRTRSSKVINGSEETTKELSDSEADAAVTRSKSSASRRNGRSSSSKNNGDKTDDTVEFGENGERGTMKMEEPPKAGLIDPVGYHTNPPPVGRPVRVYADGVFDLFHLGHMRQLQQAKQAFPNTYLIVGVTGDKETHRRKGLTVLSAKERAESVRHCKWVDEVVEDCPWIIADAPDFIEKHKIDYVAHDDIPYGADEGDDIYAPIKKEGKFLVTQRTEGVSTTGIITKIVRDYEKYISRQFKRGASRQELNVSWLKKNELEIKRSMAELRDSIKTNWTTTGQELGKDFKQFWQSSRPASPARSPASPSMPSPSALSRLSHLDIPREAPRGSSDFAQGYSLGLVSSVRSWMQRSRRNLNDESRPESPTSESDSADDKRAPSRGRKGKNTQDEVDAQMAGEMDLRT